MTLERIRKTNGRNNADTLDNATRLIREVIPNIDQKTVGTLSTNMAHVSHPDCMALLLLATRGFASVLDNPKMMGIPNKRYYTALKRLCDDGFITKGEHFVYTTTAKGMLEAARLTMALQDTAGEKKLEFLSDILKVRAFDGDVRKVLKFLDGTSSVETLSRK